MPKKDKFRFSPLIPAADIWSGKRSIRELDQPNPFTSADDGDIDALIEQEEFEGFDEVIGPGILPKVGTALGDED